MAVNQGYYGVIAAGGDGTVNETARALCDTEVVLGIIPCGSGNGLARHLGIPIEPEAAVKIIAENHIVDSDYGSVNGHPFFCTFGVGFDAAVSGNFARQQYGNNAYIAPTASITDGLLDITIIHAGNPLNTAMVGVDLFTGYINSNTLIHSFRAPSAVIYRQQEGPAHLDGEPVNITETMDIKCHANSLRIFTPTKEVKFRPIITPIENATRDLLCSITRFFSRI